jgi:hypothetical protein
MSMFKISSLKRWSKAPVLSPTGLIVRAIIIALTFVVCHGLGLREHTSFLSGTSASADTSLTASAVLGVTYIATYLGFVILTPILLIASGIQALLQRDKSSCNSV